MTDARPASGLAGHRRVPRPMMAAALLVGSLLLTSATAAGTASAVSSDGPIGGDRLGKTGLVYEATSAKVTAPPKVADAFVIADVQTGEILAARAPHAKLRPASTLKTLTSAALMPRLDPKAAYVATRADVTVDGARVGLVEDATYTIDNLWYGLLLRSGNDTATALANAFGGQAKTVAAMNAEAKRLHAKDTTAKNPSGLDADGQYTSAYDLALIARQALRTPQFVTTAGTISYNFPGAMPKAGKPRATFKIYTQNRLLLHDYPGTIAGKTGYTTLAGRTFWAAAQQDGRTLMVTMLHIETGTEDGAKALLNWGFKHAAKLSPVGELVEPEGGTGGASPAADSNGQGAVQAAAEAQSAGAAGSGTGGLSPVAWLAILLGIGGIVAIVVRTRMVAADRRRIEDRARQRRDETLAR